MKCAHNCQSEEAVDLIFSVDGMLGRCEAAPLTEVYTYDVTPATVQRFRMLLQRLAHRGRCNNVTIATAHITVAMVIRLLLDLLSIRGSNHRLCVCDS